jgi:uncharacterized protein with HEPN domain
LPSDVPIRRLEDIIDNIERIFRYTRDYGRAEFLQDQQCQDAVERCLMRISEAARKLEGFAEMIAPDQPWSGIRAVGNVLRHEYDNVEPAIIWEIVNNEVEPLRQAIEDALSKLQTKGPDAP